ncbi:hypothetical protein CTA2_508 [Colletotrichum tanaceti]|uniref:Uncharacterized protein n=1 Tax=Colletotrichum tanaceti TaxID=1306861 RepID=A0A4U6XT91_9PEZI|nr:hypothetical protein CTA2_508 [Colletotrichum tanaceti]TKW59112.1 hypothetical protein CTA1_868 [Colletotrichum tanaceti]
MVDEREIAKITLRLLAEAGETELHEQEEQPMMPSATLTSTRRRLGPGGILRPAPQSPEPQRPSQHITPKTSPGDRGHITDGRSAEEARGRHKDVRDEEAAARQYAMLSGPQSQSQSQSLPTLISAAATTETIKRLGPLPVRRAWRSRPEWAASPPPDVSRAPVLEAVMLHERGEGQSPDRQCSACRRGEGISPECVKIPGIRDGACSNCLMARASSPGPGPGQGQGPGTTASPARRQAVSTRSYSAERRSISAAIPPSVPKEDLIAVWNLIAGVLAATQPHGCRLAEDDASGPSSSSEPPPGKRIEDAARLVARSADEWGHIVKGEEEDQDHDDNDDNDDDDDSGPAKTPAERARLARQAGRIRETALLIADCARDWGEKLERKRSFSQLGK